MTLEGTHNAISLQESEDGLSHLEWLLGVTTEPFGQEVAPVSRSAPQENKKAKQTNATSGLSGLGSLESANLQSSLENKLRQLLPTVGGTMWQMIWKVKVTPAGRRFCQLAVSASRTKEIGSGLWVTPDCSDRRSANSKQQGSSNQVKASLWATPNCMDAMTARSEEALARAKTKDGCCNLKDQVHPSLWPTPNARDWKDTGNMSESMMRKDGKSRMDTLGRLTFSGSSAPTEKTAQLSVEFPCWLMGYSTAHLSSMRLAMQSYHKLRQRSSKVARIEDMF